MFVAPSPFPTGLSLKIEPDCGPQEDRKFSRIAVPQERLSCELVFYKGTFVPLSFIYCLKSCFFYGVNVPAIIWLTGNNQLLTLLFLSLLASSLESLETNIKVIVAVTSVKLFVSSV